MGEWDTGQQNDGAGAKGLTPNAIDHVCVSIWGGHWGCLYVSGSGGSEKEVKRNPFII